MEKQIWNSFKIKWPYDGNPHFLGIYLEKIIIEKQPHALFNIPRVALIAKNNLNNPRGMDKGELHFIYEYSAIKKMKYCHLAILNYKTITAK